MKLFAVLFAVILVSTQALVTPIFAVKKTVAKAGKSKAAGKGKKETFFGSVFEMDLWKDRADSNKYGSRYKDSFKATNTVGKIQAKKSYVPSGLTAAQYNQVRQKDFKKKEDNYKRNAAKGGVFQNFTAWYTGRGTDKTGAWMYNKDGRRSVTNGHTLAKTKYDWDNVQNPDNTGSKISSSVILDKKKKGVGANKKKIRGAQ